MSVLIKDVIKNSPAYKKGIQAGDALIKISGHEITDFLDYQFYTKDSKISVVFQRKDKTKAVWIKKSEDEDLGLEFETYLMDKERRCRNKCIFCFIDQLPKGLRETLYFKDDDSRLSFLHGNYITMTNLTQKEVDRITLTTTTLSKYFPKSYTPKKMEETIIKLLEQWQRKRQREQER